VFGLSIADIIVIALYFGAVLAIGVWSSRRIKNQEDFFLAGRGFGKLVQTFAAFGQGTSADSAVGVTTTVFSNGVSGMWASLLYLFATPFYWVTVPWLRRLRVLTTGDFYQERYGSRAMGAVYALIASIGMMGFIAVGFSAMTKTIVAIIPKAIDQYTDADRAAYETALASHLALVDDERAAGQMLTLDELRRRDQIQATSVESRTEGEAAELDLLLHKRPAKTISHASESTLIWLVCLVVLLYAVAGGLEAAFLTDTLQGVFIIFLSFMLIPFAWAKINAIYGGHGVTGALETIHRKLPESFFDILGSPNTTIDFAWHYILAISVMSLFNVLTQPNALVASGSAKDEYVARYGFTVGSLMKRVCTVLWGVLGLAAVVLYGSEVHHSDLVWGYATRDLLAPLGLGLVGLMIACLMAALMSTADCLMLTCSSLLTHNLYCVLIPGRSERHYVWAGRVFGAIILVGSALLATQFDTILQMLKFIWEFPVMLAPALWLGVKWRGANRNGAWASIIVGGLLFFVVPNVLPAVVPSLKTNEYLLGTTQPSPVVRTYTAGEHDVRVRLAEIQAWEQLDAEGKATTPRKQELRVGEEFETTFVLPRKSLFWFQDISVDRNGRRVGQGSLNLELVALDLAGWDLSQNTHALNQTVRIVIRVLVPFGLMYFVSLFFPHRDPKVVDPFFAKMRTRVRTDREEDAREVALSLANTDRYRERLLFPNSQWELFKWDREDVAGFLLTALAIAIILLLTQVFVSLGG